MDHIHIIQDITREHAVYTGTGSARKTIDTLQHW